jgi:hypothetical protein
MDTLTDEELAWLNSLTEGEKRFYSYLWNENHGKRRSVSKEQAIYDKARRIACERFRGAMEEIKLVGIND